MKIKTTSNSHQIHYKDKHFTTKKTSAGRYIYRRALALRKTVASTLYSYCAMNGCKVAKIVPLRVNHNKGVVRIPPPYVYV